MGYWDYEYSPDIQALYGQKIVDAGQDRDAVWFQVENGYKIRIEHHQDCCESVYLEDVTGGTMDELIGETLVQVRQSYDDLGPQDEWTESYTWTFWHIETDKSSLTCRWYGSSNGYYGESADAYGYPPSAEA